MKILLSLFVVSVFLLSGWSAGAGAKERNYIGVKKCRTCHKSRKSGNQFGVWQKTKHAKAYHLLRKPKAKKAAQQVGVSGNPQKSEACLVCHTTGYGVDRKLFRRKFKVEDGVQCEACHGPGSEYKSKKRMRKMAKERGPDRKGDSPTARKYGLTYPNAETCKRCHTQQITYNGKVYKNPNYQPFDFDTQFEKIKHFRER